MNPIQTVIVALASVVVMVVGVALLAGVAWALIVGGALTLVFTLLLYDPKRGSKPGSRR